MTREEAIGILKNFTDEYFDELTPLGEEALNFLMQSPRWLKLSDFPLLPEHIGQSAWISCLTLGVLGPVGIRQWEERIDFNFDANNLISHYYLIGYPPKFEGEK